MVFGFLWVYMITKGQCVKQGERKQGEREERWRVWEVSGQPGEREHVKVNWSKNLREVGKARDETAHIEFSVWWANGGFTNTMPEEHWEWKIGFQGIDWIEKRDLVFFMKLGLQVVRTWDAGFQGGKGEQGSIHTCAHTHQIMT